MWDGEERSVQIVRVSAIIPDCRFGLLELCVD